MVLYIIEFEFNINNKGHYHSCHNVSANEIHEAQQKAFDEFKQSNDPNICNIIRSIVKNDI